MKLGNFFAVAFLFANLLLGPGAAMVKLDGVTSCTSSAWVGTLLFSGNGLKSPNMLSSSPCVYSSNQLPSMELQHSKHYRMVLPICYHIRSFILNHKVQQE